MSRTTVGIAILMVWLGALGWLISREYGRAESEILAEAALSVAPGASFYQLSLAGQQIGFASTTVDTTPEGITVQDVMVLELPVMGELQRTDVRTQALLNRSLGLKEFDARVRSSSIDFFASGSVVGDSLLVVELESSGNVQSFEVPLERSIILPTMVPLRLAFGGELEVGNTIRFTTFDPLVMSEREVEVAVIADSVMIVTDSAAFDSSSAKWVPARWDTVQAWRIIQRNGDLASEAWIDALGRVVIASSPVGLRMERSAFEIAYENFRRRDPVTVASTAVSGDIIRQTAIASDADLDPDQLRELVVRIGGVDTEGFDLAGDRQRLSGDTVRIRRETIDRSAVDYRLPSGDASLARYLRAEPLVQVDDPRIQAQARQIVGRTRNPIRAAQLINDWVHEQLDKEITVSVPSAVQVLDARSGDCNEHTVLYVALARAAGLPARTAAGLVYLNGSFYYHAWPEIYLDGWVAVDPTLGQFPADAAHVRFVIGGLARQVELLRLIGRLDLNVLETRS